MQKLFALFVGIMILGCDGDPAATTTPADSQQPAFALAGSWEGTYAVRDLNNPASSRAILTLQSSGQDRSGLFELKLADSSAGTTRGTFQDFMGKSLIMQLADSTISTFGLRGDSISVDYVLQGTALQLSNSRLDLKLLKGNSSNGSPQPSPNPSSAPAPDPTNPLHGFWTCFDKSNNNLRLEIQAGEFWMETTNGRSVWMWGQPTLYGNAGELNVSRSNVEQYKTLRMFAELLGSQLSLKVAGNSNEPGFTCSRG